MTHRFTRQELYDLVWEEPRSTLAKRYDVSDVALAKACRRAGIPMPDRGYWAKRQAGRRSIRPDLPPRAPGHADAVVVGHDHRRGYHLLREDEDNEPLPPPPTFPEPLDEVVQRVRKSISAVRFSRSLEKLHPQIAWLLDEDERKRQKYKDSLYKASWEQTQFDSPIERRRLRILNSLFLALAQLGAKPTVRGDKARDVSVRVGEEYVSLTLDDPAALVPSRRPSKSKSRPNQLRLEVSSSPLPGVQTKWEEATEGSLSNHLSEIVASVLIAGELRYREHLEREYRWRVERKAELEEEARQQRAEEERLARERQRKAEKARLDRLLADAAAWRQASEVRAFVAAVRAKRARECDPLRSDELERWAGWALSRAEELDPLSRAAFTGIVPAHTETPSADT